VAASTARRRNGADPSAKNIFVLANPLVMDADFAITTCISGFTPQAGHQQAGLICYHDDDNYAKWVYEFNWPQGSGQVLGLVRETNAESTIEHVTDPAAKVVFPQLKFTISGSDGYVFTSPVGSFRPDAFGLYDVHGNAWQWCSDWNDEHYDEKSPVDDPKGPPVGSARVARGGLFYSSPALVRCAYRACFAPSFRAYSFGFRVCQR
jgi:formylglycine-generating enzyme required for sulfatase activity